MIVHKPSGVLFGAIIALLLAMVSSLSAQTSGGSISGAVTDASGAVISGATVRVTNTGTSISRETQTGATGRYMLPQLPIGSYEVAAESSGFQSIVRRGIEITVGRAAVVDFALVVGAVSERVLVTGEAPLVESQNAAISNLIESKTVAELPLNGRSFDRLITLSTGAVNIRTSGGGSTMSGLASVYSVGGARTGSNKFNVDGTELSGGGQANSNPGAVSGENLGIESLAEFRVLTNNYGAEYGKKAGGTINVVTKSGTNAFHGSLFAFHRNDNFDARDFFTAAKPEFRRNNFGAAAGGRLIPDKLFFFGNYEGLREELGTTVNTTVPTADARRGILAGGATVIVDPRIQPYLALFPLPTERPNADGVSARFRGPGNQITRQDFWTTRLDYQHSSKDSLSQVYRFDDADRTSTNPTNPNFFNPRNNRQQLITIQETHIFLPTLLNVFRVGFGRWAGIVDDFVPHTEVPPFAAQFLRMGQITIPGFTSLGPVQPVLIFVNNNFEVEDQMSMTRGSHGIKFGVQMQRLQKNVDAPTLRYGRYDFSNYANFLQARPSVFTGPLPGGVSAKGYRQTLLGLYIQDDWVVTPKLTLNLGLRYETLSAPLEVNGAVSNWDETTVNGYRFIVTEPSRRNPAYDDNSKTAFAPRLGFAWRPLASDRTVLRGGGGIFYDQLLDFYGFALSNGPPFTVAGVDNPPFPNPFSASLGRVPPLQVGGTTREMEVPTRVQFNFQIQQQLSDAVVLSVGYVGSASYHLTRSINANTAFPTEVLPDGRKFFAAGSPSRNPQLAGTGRFIVTDSNGRYNSLQVDFRTRAMAGWRFQSAYTWSKSMDDSSSNYPGEGGGEVGSSQDPDGGPRLERGLSLYHVNHNFNSNFGYEFPFANKLNGLAKLLLGGWQANGIITLHSGLPLGPRNGRNIIVPQNRDQQGNDRPDLAPGASANPSSGVSMGCPTVPAGTAVGTPRLYFDPCAFTRPALGFFGNLGRNTLIGPGVAVVDFSMFKNIPLREGISLQFRSEVFNLFNRPNFGNPNLNLFSNINGARVGNSGEITTTTTTSRQIQFGLKLLW